MTYPSLSLALLFSIYILMKFTVLKYVFEFERTGRFRFKIRRQLHEYDNDPYVCGIEGCDYMCFSQRTLLVHKGCDHGQGVLEAVPIESPLESEAIDWCEEATGCEEEKEHVPPRCAVWIRCNLCSYKCLFEESMKAHMALHERIG